MNIPTSTQTAPEELLPELEQLRVRLEDLLAPKRSLDGVQIWSVSERMQTLIHELTHRELLMKWSEIRRRLLQKYGDRILELSSKPSVMIKAEHSSDDLIHDSRRPSFLKSMIKAEHSSHFVSYRIPKIQSLPSSTTNDEPRVKTLPAEPVQGPDEHHQKACKNFRKSLTRLHVTECPDADMLNRLQDMINDRVRRFADNPALKQALLNIALPIVSPWLRASFGADRPDQIATLDELLTLTTNECNVRYNEAKTAMKIQKKAQGVKRKMDDDGPEVAAAARRKSRRLSPKEADDVRADKERLRSLARGKFDSIDAAGYFTAGSTGPAHLEGLNQISLALSHIVPDARNHAHDQNLQYDLFEMAMDRLPESLRKKYFKRHSNRNDSLIRLARFINNEADGAYHKVYDLRKRALSAPVGTPEEVPAITID